MLLNELGSLFSPLRRSERNYFFLKPLGRNEQAEMMYFPPQHPYQETWALTQTLYKLEDRVIEVESLYKSI